MKMTYGELCETVINRIVELIALGDGDKGVNLPDYARRLAVNEKVFTLYIDRTDGQYRLKINDVTYPDLSVEVLNVDMQYVRYTTVFKTVVDFLEGYLVS